MVELAVVVTSRQQLAERLAAWPQADEGTTWGLVFIKPIPGAGELAAMREAAKLCDRVVGVVRAEEGKKGQTGPKLAEICREAGCDLLWVPKEKTGFVTVDCGVDGVDGTLLAQAVMTILPMLVMAHRADVALIRALRNIQGGLGEVFSLRLAG